MSFSPAIDLEQGMSNDNPNPDLNDLEANNGYKVTVGLEAHYGLFNWCNFVLSLAILTNFTTYYNTLV